MSVLLLQILDQMKEQGNDYADKLHGSECSFDSFSFAESHLGETTSEVPSRSVQPDTFPTRQLFYLALVRLAEPVALTSIYPYAYRLVVRYQDGEESNAAFHAGLLISAFAFAEACTGMYWGALSDRIGRKPVLLVGCVGTLISLLLVGFAQNLWIALAGRTLGGLLNGNIGVIQTMVGELVRKPEHEPRAYAVMPFIWCIGTVIGPSIGGLFAEPVKNFPSMFSSYGLFAHFPYLLPNLICATLLLASIVTGCFFLTETRPDSGMGDQTKDTADDSQMTISDATSCLSGTKSYGTFDGIGEFQNQEEFEPINPARRLSGDTVVADMEEPSVFNSSVITLIVAFGIFTYHTMTYDNLIPIYLQGRDSDVLRPHHIPPLLQSPGLGLSVREVGIVMSINGAIALFIQAIIFPCLAARISTWRLFILVTIGHPIVYILVPLLPLLPETWLYTGIYACSFIREFFAIVQYPLLLILLKNAAPSPAHLGKVNGLAASVGAACRTIAGPASGLLWGLGRRIDVTMLAWWASAAIALVGAAQVFMVRKKKGVGTGEDDIEEIGTGGC
ncbi:MFS general substrate transporter [Pseudovirgaria hyperparasitica]|uniref:MFS general substrate transporter n=1 Tax=Pseudovirgaria hyperparasitica TaxID=470096 RepID=A0A6A6W0Q7_9PEZI|nr:MFS general substrate transporter [Pseudovirgaria hyperparasitica]KAF2756095.1 MFS general substrate transporter [Pseudovirgaria hyperparasitica]